MNIVKGIGAVLAGLIFIIVSHSATDSVLESLGIFTPPEAGFHTTWMVLTATAYRSVFSVVGGYITAALAPDKPMRYAVILGIIGLVAGCCNSDDSDGNRADLVSDRSGCSSSAVYMARG